MKPLFTDDDVAAADREIELAVAAKESAGRLDAVPASSRSDTQTENLTDDDTFQDLLESMLDKALLEGMYSAGNLDFIPDGKMTAGTSVRTRESGLESPLHLSWLLAASAAAIAAAGGGLSLDAWTTSACLAGVTFLSLIGRAEHGLWTAAMSVHFAAVAVSASSALLEGGQGGLEPLVGGITAAVAATVAGRRP